jgi:hypothetical protein
VRHRPGRMAQNPKTLEKVPVPPKRVVKFKVGNVMRKRVEEGGVQPQASSVAPTMGGEPGGMTPPSSISRS